MAEKLIQRWKLAVLRIGLDLSGRPPGVVSRLAGYASGSDVTYWTRSDPLNTFGLSMSAEVPLRVELPRSFVHAVQETLRNELTDQSALWLRLEPPSGYLAAAPWEDLADDINIPVLRVPDRLPVATQLGRTWRVAMAVNAPARARWGSNHVRRFTTALNNAFYDRPVEVDIFADAFTYKLLMDEADRANSRMRLHDPAFARDAHVRRSSESRVVNYGRLTSGLQAFESVDDPRLLWADWITSGLAGVAVNAFHVASVGSVSGVRPVLAIAPDPSRPSAAARNVYIDSDDLRSISDVLGAGLVSVAAPEFRTADVGARVVADRLGQQRPGPTIFSSLKRDPYSRALAELHAFLSEPQSRKLPSSSSWFGYIQPESISAALPEPLLPHYTGQETWSKWSRGSGAGVETRSLTERGLADKFDNADEVPAWVASSSRFLETKLADLTTLFTTPGEGKASKNAYDVGASEALADIEAMVQRHIGEY
jgi:hypothetical protein